MKQAALFLCILSTLAITTPTWSQTVDASPLETYLRTLKSGFDKIGPKPFKRLFPNGKLEQTFAVSGTTKSFTEFDIHGAKVLEWSRKNNGQIVYESWYAPQRTRERLLEDDRNVSYTSFRENGQKWEQYSCNKLKDLKAYYVYDKNGKLIK